MASQGPPSEPPPKPFASEEAAITALGKAEDPAVRIKAAEMLGQDRSAKGGEAMVAAYPGEKIASVRAAMARALGAVANEKARDFLLASLDTEKTEEVRISCYQALAKFKGDTKVAARIGETLRQEKAANTCAAAILALRDLRTKGTDDFLVDYIRDLEGSLADPVKAVAIGALLDLHPEKCLDTVTGLANVNETLISYGTVTKAAMAGALGQLAGPRNQELPKSKQSAPVKLLPVFLKDSAAPVKLAAVRAAGEAGSGGLPLAWDSRRGLPVPKELGEMALDEKKKVEDSLQSEAIVALGKIGPGNPSSPVHHTTCQRLYLPFLMLRGDLDVNGKPLVPAVLRKAVAQSLRFFARAEHDRYPGQSSQAILILSAALGQWSRPDPDAEVRLALIDGLRLEAREPETVASLESAISLEYAGPNQPAVAAAIRLAIAAIRTRCLSRPPQ